MDNDIFNELHSVELIDDEIIDEIMDIKDIDVNKTIKTGSKYFSDDEDWIEYSFLSKILNINNLPELCNSCGIKKHKHDKQRHLFKQILSSDRCKYCGCFFFEHKQHFSLELKYTDFINNHPYVKSLNKF